MGAGPRNPDYDAGVRVVPLELAGSVDVGSSDAHVGVIPNELGTGAHVEHRFERTRRQRPCGRCSARARRQRPRRVVPIERARGVGVTPLQPGGTVHVGVGCGTADRSACVRDRDVLRVAVAHLDDRRIERDQLAVRVLETATAILALGHYELIAGAPLGPPRISRAVEAAPRVVLNP